MVERTKYKGNEAINKKAKKEIDGGIKGIKTVLNKELGQMHRRWIDRTL